MSHHFWGRFFWSGLLAALLPAAQVLGLSVTGLAPSGYQVAALGPGSVCYTDAGPTIASIPPALTGGTLIRTKAGDAANPSLTVSFQVDVRAEVYVCCDSGAAPPSWLSSWVHTDMTVAVSGPTATNYSVYAKRFGAGAVQLSANQAGAMYFVVVKESLPIFPRNGWVLLSYDMPYLREIIRQAPLYHVNHIELSHDIMMYIWQPLESPTLRADLNELIDLAHAYGITDVTVWTHEFGTHALPVTCRENNSPGGRVDGDKAETWTWTQNCYNQLFSAGTGCPELDGVVVTYSEVDGVELWDRGQFKFNGTGGDAVKKSIQTVQAACHTYGKTFYARTWAGDKQFDVRDGVASSNDTTTWMSSKNIGGTQGWDWQYMDTHLDVIGTLPAGYNEIIEFDLCGEYLGRSQYTFCMTSYLKDHWNYAYNLGVRGGMVARIDREGGLTPYTANLINLYALDQILANRNADPAALNLAWCQQHFPLDAAQDIADHYDAPGTPWGDDTRLMTWEAFYPGLSPVINAEALSIGYDALGRIDKHRAQLEIQTTLDTRNLKSDYQVLRNGIAIGVLDLGGPLPETLGFFNFRSAWTTVLNPDCLIDIHLPSPGVDPITATCEVSTDGGAQWASWPVVCSGPPGSTATQTITAAAIPLNLAEEDRNFIRFQVSGMNGIRIDSGVLKVRLATPIVWSAFAPQVSFSLTPDCTVSMIAASGALDPATARYQYSRDGGLTWVGAGVNWQGRYECSTLPWQDGWTVVEGQTGYESVNNGILNINDNSTAGGTKVKYARTWNVNPAVGATVEAKMQCLSGGHFFSSNLELSDPLHFASFYLKANGMVGLYPDWILVATDTHEWHTYRVTIRGTDINVYVDGNPQPVMPGDGFFLGGAATPQQLLFGSGSSAGTQQVRYDYLYWTTQGAFPPTDSWPAVYSGNGQNATITATGVPFSQYSSTLNKIRFSIADLQGRIWQSPVYNATISTPPPVAPVIAAISSASILAPSAYTGPTPALIQGTLPVTWSLVSGPAGMTINTGTGVVSWPTSTTTGSPHTITIQATNTAGNDQKSWQLTVAPPAPVAPVIAAIPGASILAPSAYTGPTPTLTQGTLPVTWSLVTGPAGMTIDAGTGVVSWPTSTATGSPHTITIEATNAVGSGQMSWQLTVTLEDTAAPIVTIVSPTNGQAVSSSSITVSGTATDAGRGDNGISSVMVNGVGASGGTTSGPGTANWSRSIILSQGSNTITVLAKDNSANQNAATASITIDYQPAGLTITSIEITGPVQVNENSGAQYTCTASYSDGSKAPVTGSASWSTNSSYASISSGGYLSTNEVTSAQSCQVTATYREKTATYEVMIQNTAGRYVLTVSPRPSDGGTIITNPVAGADGKYAFGTVVKLTPSPSPGYSFVFLNGDVAGWASPRYITMDGDKAVTVYFSNVPVDYPGAAWIAEAAGEFTQASRGPADVTSIVIHTTEDASPGASISGLQNPAEDTCAHYLVQRDGRVLQSVRERDIAHQTESQDWDQQSIGIAVERLANATEGITNAQYNAVKSLVDSIRTRFNVPLVFPVGTPSSSPTVPVDGLVGHGKVVTNGVEPVKWDWAYFRSLFGASDVVNTEDSCPGDPNKTAPGICGCGVPDLDSDHDGTPDCNDGCPNDPDKVSPGTEGCGVNDTTGQPDAGQTIPDPSPAPLCGWGFAESLWVSMVGLGLMSVGMSRRRGRQS